MSTSLQILRQVKEALSNRDSFLHLRGDFYLTKSQPNYSDVLLQRDFNLESRTQNYIEESANSKTLLARYKAYDQELHLETLPTHYPMKIVSGAGSICSGDNIFMFFPMVLGLAPNQREDSFGFEFIDIWKNIFYTSIFPCIKEVFALESQLQIHINLFQDIERTIYLASVFHELGHEVGPWRVSPAPREEMLLDGYELDVLGELSTDSLMILFLKEFPEVAQFVILQRLFWFTRRGFRENPLHGKLNIDNDSWIGLYLWRKLHQYGVLSSNSQNRLRFNQAAVSECFKSIIHEIDGLYKPGASANEQRLAVQNWQRDSVGDSYQNGKFRFPEELQNILGRCQNIVEVPQFFPAFGYHHINNIKEMCS